MAKQNAFLVVGLPHTGVPLLTAALEAHRNALETIGVRVPAKSADEMFRAAVEVRREHRAWGLRRKDVEGTWHGIARHALKHRGTVVVGHDLLSGAAPDEVALLVDGLAGCQLHVVVLAAPPDPRVALFPDELDLAGVVERWGRAVTAPQRLHVMVADPLDPGAAWAALGRLAGFDARVLAVPGPATPAPPADTATLRLIAEGSGMHADHEELVELAHHWARVVDDGGYDVLGDLRDLVPVRPSGPTDPARAAYDGRIELLTGALTEAVAEVGRLRERVALLEQEPARHERRRRPLGRRLRAVG